MIGDLSSKAYRILECLFNKFTINPNIIFNFQEIILSSFSSFLNTQNKNLFEFTISWMIKLFINLNEADVIFLNLIFGITQKNKIFFQSKCEANSKKFNIEENYYFKLLKKGQDELGIFYKIAFLYESFDKNFNRVINKSTPNVSTLNRQILKDMKKKLKNKNKIIIDCFIKDFGKNFIDFLFISLSNKIKNQNNKDQDSSQKSQEISELDSEKYSFKFVFQNYDLISYFFEKILISLNFTGHIFNFTNSINQEYNRFSTEHYNLLSNAKRKQLLTLLLIFIKLMGVEFNSKLMSFLKNIIEKNKNQINDIIKKIDFSILFEYGIPVAYNILDPKLTYLKELENIIIDFLSPSEKLKNESLSSIKKEILISNNLMMLKNLICLFEDLLKILRENKDFHLLTDSTNSYQNLNVENVSKISRESCLKVNVYPIYNFYFMLQLRLFKNFVFTLNSVKDKNIENTIYNDNIAEIKALLASQGSLMSEKNKVLEEFSFLIKNDVENSLIFHNWVKFFFKNGNILDAYKIMKNILTNEKKPPFVLMLYNLNYEISKFYPGLWKYYNLLMLYIINLASSAIFLNHSFYIIFLNFKI